jgi:branched-chain amino acid transport system substrate-binding protein
VRNIGSFWIERGISLVVALILVLGLGATIGGATSAAASSPSGTPLVLGIISSDTGPVVTTDQSTTVKAWTKYTNSHGGINGHPVKIDYFNDTSSAATAIQDATTLIQNDHVIAIGDASQTGTAFASVADKAHIPVLSLVGDHVGPYNTDPNLFADGETSPSEFWANANDAVLSGHKKIAVLYCSEVAACAQAVSAVKAADEGTIVYSAGISGSAPNYTAVCLAARAAGANAVDILTPFVTAVQRLLDNCAAQGYHPTPVEGGVSVTPSLEHDANIPDLWVFSIAIPFFVHNSATKILDKVMGSYLPHATTESNVVEDWTGLEMFAAAAANIPKSATPTAQDIYTGLYSLDGSTLGGLSVPLTFHKGVANPVSCNFVYEVKSGHFSLPEGLKPVCQPHSS